MKKVFLTLVVMLTTISIFAQDNYQDVVYLKGGNTIRGTITEQTPYESLKIETADGSIFILKLYEVAKITKEIFSNQTQNVANSKSSQSKVETKPKLEDKILAFSHISYSHLLGCSRLQAQDNKIGFTIDSIAKEEGENKYFVHWRINRNDINSALIATRLRFIDPDDFSNYTKGSACYFKENAGQYDMMIATLDRPAQSLIIYFEGIEAIFGEEYTTTAMFFIAELGNNPKLLDKQARDANELFKKAELKQEYKSNINIVRNTKDQTVLLKIASESDEWEIRNIAFEKLDAISLAEIINLTKDQAVAIAAKISLNKTTWDEEFKKSTTSKISLSNVIGAAALVQFPKPASQDVVSACHKFIRQGDASRIPELIHLLDDYGDATLAEDYMNCGESRLYDAGCHWGKQHGYSCGTGYGSHRVTWGSSR